MAKLLKLRRGTTSQHGSFTGAEGEVTVDTDKETLVVHDGSTAGGHPVAAEDMANVSSSAIAGRLSNDSIATSKIAGGTLPSDVTIASINIVDGSIVNSDLNAGANITSGKLATTGVSAGSYGSSSAIPIVTVNAQGQVTSASTTAIDSTTIANGTSNVAVANNGNITTTRSGTARHVVDDAGVHVTGTLDVSGQTSLQGDLTINEENPAINFSDSGENPDYQVRVDAGKFFINDTTNSAARLTVQTDGHIDIPGRIDATGGVAVSGNITCTGTIDGVDVAGLYAATSGLSTGGGVLHSSASIANGVTAHTQAQSDNSTKVSTTAYVRTAISEAQAFPSGTKMLFQQTSAPTGWTKITSGVNNKALRVVSGSVGSGGNVAFTTAFGDRGITANAGNTTQGGNVSVANTTQGGNVSVANSTAGGNISVANASAGGNVNSHTLSTNEMPSHSHSYGRASAGNGPIVLTWESGTRVATNSSGNTSNTGGGGGHSHGFTGGSHSHNASFSGSAHNHNATFSGSAHNHNATFSGSAHNHSISVTNLDMQAEYLDVIIASKD